MSFQQQIDDFIQRQVVQWDFAANNYNGLAKVVTRSVSLGLHDVLIQFNPERIRSSAAKVDAQSIEARPCFLCQQNLPSQQQFVPFGDEYVILVNPFPIFHRHLTIPSVHHTIQAIDGRMGDMLDLAYVLDGFTLFYNGPKCGASAPDHFHFQAGEKGFMPIEAHFRQKLFCRLIHQHRGVAVWGWNDYLRGTISIVGQEKQDVVACFSHLYSSLSSIQPGEIEPMLNVLALYEDQHFVLHVFPRRLHRPSQFFAQGDEQILLSPASVDMGGVLITPREEDFRKLDAPIVRSIFEQVSLSQTEAEQLIANY